MRTLKHGKGRSILWLTPRTSCATAWASTCAAALLLLHGGCADDSDNGVEDGVYEGETGTGGDVIFKVSSGEIEGDFEIVTKTSCGQLSFLLDGVDLSDGELMLPDEPGNVIEVSGMRVSSDSFEGTYVVDGEFEERGTCMGSGTWGASQSAAANGSGPKIVACDTIRDGSCTFPELGCEPGIASFSVSIMSSGCSGAYFVTCQAGCIATVVPR